MSEEMSSFETSLETLPEVLQMAATISAIESKKPLVQKYRSVQALQLTDLQCKLLAHVDESKMAEAKLRDLMDAFKTLKTMEQLMDGKPTEIKGLVAYLIEIEKEKAQDAECRVNNDDAVDVTVEDVPQPLVAVDAFSAFVEETAGATV